MKRERVVSRERLLELGAPRSLIDSQVKRGLIEAVFRGVYGLSRDLLGWEDRCRAAALSIGDDGVVTHRCSAALLGMRAERPVIIDITTPRRLGRREGIALHRLPLAADEIMHLDGIPTTTPARTLFDLATVLPAEALVKALRQAEYLRLSGGPSLPELVERYPRRAGIRRVRELLEKGWSEAPLRSDLERRFLVLIDEENLPRPEVNALIHRFEVDFLWRAHKLVVELDGYAAHGTRSAFELDRERDRALQAAGFRVIRITWRQLHHDRAAVVRDLSRLLRRPPRARAA